MKYCQHCGTELEDTTKFCSHCGKNTIEEEAEKKESEPKVQISTDEDIVKTLSQRLQTNSTIWMIIGIAQIVIGIGTILPLVVGILNIMSASKEKKNTERILTDPTGIVSEYEPIEGPIITLAYNLLFGGVFGVAGSIYHLICIRQYVVDNKEKFLEIENQQ